MILIGSISQQFQGLNRAYFAFGACSASFVWFFAIAYGAKLLTPIMQKPRHWRILDSIDSNNYVYYCNQFSISGWLDLNLILVKITL
jgi:arginine exporter protein ArgO